MQTMIKMNTCLSYTLRAVVLLDFILTATLPVNRHAQIPPARLNFIGFSLIAVPFVLLAILLTKSSEHRRKSKFIDVLFACAGSGLFAFLATSSLPVI